MEAQQCLVRGICIIILFRTLFDLTGACADRNQGGNGYINGEPSPKRPIHLDRICVTLVAM